MHKPAYKTTEFWVTLGTFISSGLFLLGSIGADTRDTLTSVSHHVIESIALIIAQVAVYLNYRKMKQSQAALNNELEAKKDNAQTENTEIQPVVQEQPKNENISKSKPVNRGSKKTQNKGKSASRRGVENTSKRSNRNSNRNSKRTK